MFFKKKKFDIIKKLYAYVELECEYKHWTHILILPDDLKYSRRELAQAIRNYCVNFLDPGEFLDFDKNRFEYNESLDSIKKTLTGEAK